MALYVKFECKTCENENCYGHSLPTTEKVCDGYKHTTTNADRIRTMSDEEMADWIETIAPSKEWSYALSGKAWLDWLRQEAKDV